jgi:Family of unknown function (DUF6117)
MAIPDGIKQNFETLRKAFNNGDIALMECTDKTTGMPAYVVCAVAFDGEEEEGGDAYTLVPFAVMDHELIHKVTPPTEIHNSLGQDA